MMRLPPDHPVYIEREGDDSHHGMIILLGDAGEFH